MPGDCASAYRNRHRVPTAGLLALLGIEREDG